MQMVFHTHFKEDNKSELFHLFADYIQYSDVDLIFDECVQKPETVGDTFLVTNLDLLVHYLENFHMPANASTYWLLANSWQRMVSRP